MSEESLLLKSPDSDADTHGGRALPSNVEAEAAFLGAILIDNSVYEELANPLRPEHFFVPAHRLIMDRFLTMLERGATASPVTLKPYFEGNEHLEQLGGTTYLARLTADGHGLLAARQLAEQIYDLALLRELVTVGRTLVSDALDTSETVEPLKQIETAEAALYDVGVEEWALMSLAGHGAADWIARVCAGGPVTVLCGPGNNGGDGYVAAAALAARGIPVRVVAPIEPKTELARQTNWAKWLMPALTPLLNTARQGALPALQAATDPAAQGGEYYGPYGFMELKGATSGRAVATATARDPLLAARLWEVSKDMTGVDPGLAPAT